MRNKKGGGMPPFGFMKKENLFHLEEVCWRRRRDSNPRYPYGVYTISNRARSTGLRDFSIFGVVHRNECYYTTGCAKCQHLNLKILKYFFGV